jgi:hypothetical protein
LWDNISSLGVNQRQCGLRSFLSKLHLVLSTHTVLLSYIRFALNALTNNVFLYQVVEVQNINVKCLVKNSATLTGAMFTAHAAQVQITLPTLSEFDKEVTRKF